MRPHSRRSVLASLAGLGASAAFGSAIRSAPANAAPGPILKRLIPRTGEEIPAIGMGTWITFNVGADAALRGARVKVMEAFFAGDESIIPPPPAKNASMTLTRRARSAASAPTLKVIQVPMPIAGTCSPVLGIARLGIGADAADANAFGNAAAAPAPNGAPTDAAAPRPAREARTERRL